MKNTIQRWLSRSGTNGEQDEKFLPQVWERLQNGSENDNMIVARALPSTNRFSKWVVIYQRKTNDIRDQYFKLRYTIHEFELPVSDKHFGPDEKTNKRTWYVRKEEEIYELLSRLGIRPGNFNSPTLCNYPFPS
jgi:hypothetical protein